MTDMYDFCVIGAGMIGSSAAKYLSKKQGNKVALIGTIEPQRNDYQNHSIFGAHYDEGRITRNLDNNPLWGHLARESIKRYKEIEDETGIQFFTENGYLVIVDENLPEVQENKDCAQSLNVPIQVLPTSKNINTASAGRIPVDDVKLRNKLVQSMPRDFLSRSLSQKCL